MPVTKLDITHRAPVAGGRPFGEAGPFEYLEGTIHFAVNPKHPNNARITDIGFLRVEDDGRVHFSADFALMKPVQAAPGGRLLYNVVNRGKDQAMHHYNWVRGAQGCGPEMNVGDGFLQRHGFTIAWCGWQVDVPPGPGQMQMEAPAPVGADGQPLTGMTFVQYQPTKPARAAMLSDRGHKPLPTIDLNDPSALLTVREHPDAPPRVVPREQWQFARDEDGKPVADPRYMYLAEGFRPGLVYELSYTTGAWPAIGLSFLATRDVASFLRYGSAAEGNPSAGSIEHAYAFGASMSGRYLRELLWLGINEDEEGRKVFDGIHSHTGSARRGEFNIRAGQPSSNFTRAPGNVFPFTWGAEHDPVTGESGGILGTLPPDRMPKVIATNSGIEYWWSGTSLTHTDVTGAHDIDPPDNVRIYYMAGSHHTPGVLELSDRDAMGFRTGNLQNTLDYTPILRAALLGLDRWVREGVEPPPSRYPRIGDGTAVTRESVKPLFTALPGAVFPKALALRRRMDFGPRLSEGIPHYPPEEGPAYLTLVSAVDEDGNEVSGVRLPDVQVPLATFTGWNTRHADVGGEGQQVVSGPLIGSVFPFPRTREEREATGDLRYAIDERYASKAEYLVKVDEALQALVAQGYVLAEDRARLLEAADRQWELFRNGKQS